MLDRFQKLSKVICSYSLNLKENEKVWVEFKGNNTKYFIKELIKEILNHKAVPYIKYIDEEIMANLISSASTKQMKDYCDMDYAMMTKMDAYVSLRGSDNIYEFSKIPAAKKQEFDKLYAATLNYRVEKTRWLAMRYPTYSMAQLAYMPNQDFEDYYFSVCTLDYSKLSKAMDKLVALMQKTRKVKIIGPNTNLEFSIENIPVIKCDGRLNLPDGEVYTAPVKESVNGTISYNTPSNINGITHENIFFTVKDGKIIDAKSSQQNAIDNILNTDAGARYFGEFAIGVNPLINAPMLDTLFDEKIYGSIHLTPGRAYGNAYNGNDSAVHWDLILIQTKKYGGGELYFDDVLVRKNGEFILKELDCLSKEKLLN